MMSCNTGFHDRCFDDVCGCLCGHRALRESVPAPKPASEHVALQDANERARDAIAEYARTELGSRLNSWLK